eukprot:scaffold21291_cov75-Skeletonema_menzelii.AAC.1
MIEKEVYDACYFDTDESRVTQDLVTKCNSMITADGGVVKTFIELDLQEFNDDDTIDKTTSQEMIEKEVYDACYFDTDETRVTQDLVTKCNSVCKS